MFILEQYLNEFDKLPERVQEEIDDIISHYKGSLIFHAMRCESPIEQLLFLHLLEMYFDERYQLKIYDPNSDLRITPQEEIKIDGKRYRIDFEIKVTLNNKTHYFAIECDGHEFHEKTKEQATKDRKRERKLIEHGYHVIRFTGSEIWEDPAGCAYEVFSIANKISGLEELIDETIKRDLERLED